MPYPMISEPLKFSNFTKHAPFVLLVPTIEMKLFFASVVKIENFLNYLELLLDNGFKENCLLILAILYLISRLFENFRIFENKIRSRRVPKRGKSMLDLSATFKKRVFYSLAVKKSRIEGHELR